MRVPASSHSRATTTRRTADRGPGLRTWHTPPVGAPSVIDLFSGAGGASRGLVEAGFDLRLAVDVDPPSAETHHANLPGEFLLGDLRVLEAEKSVALPTSRRAISICSSRDHLARVSRYLGRVWCGTVGTTCSSRYFVSRLSFAHAAQLSRMFRA